MAIKTFHEAPLYWFDKVQSITDGDYALVHLMEENPEYLDKFIQAREKGRHVILDNSVFELEVPFDVNTFAKWVELVKPTEYIIPDKLEDAETTVKNVQEWNYGMLPGKTMGVVQGKTYEEIKWCYQEIAPFVDRIAISFDYSYYETLDYDNKLKCWDVGRRKLLLDMLDEEIIDESKEHHLLGLGTLNGAVGLSKFKFVTSIDTSNPVMWAFAKGIYPKNVSEITTKPTTKLFTLMDFEPKEEGLKQMLTEDIVHNIKRFREVL